MIVRLPHPGPRKPNEPPPRPRRRGLRIGLGSRAWRILKAGRAEIRLAGRCLIRCEMGALRNKTPRRQPLFRAVKPGNESLGRGRHLAISLSCGEAGSQKTLMDLFRRLIFFSSAPGERAASSQVPCAAECAQRASQSPDSCRRGRVPTSVTLSDQLEGVGSIVVGPVPSVERALKAIESDREIEAALDVNLGGVKVRRRAFSPQCAGGST
jgi:hypothetical protein